MILKILLYSKLTIKLGGNLLISQYLLDSCSPLNDTLKKNKHYRFTSVKSVRDFFLILA